MNDENDRTDLEPADTAEKKARRCSTPSPYNRREAAIEFAMRWRGEEYANMNMDSDSILEDAAKYLAFLEADVTDVERHLHDGA